MIFDPASSYLDTMQYFVRGLPEEQRISVYHGADSCLAYYRTIWNNSSPDDFTRSVIRRQGGATYGLGSNHWRPDVWQGFVAFLTERHEAAMAHRRELLRKHPDVEFSAEEPLILPRPLYYDAKKREYRTEEWYIPPADRAPLPATLALLECRQHLDSFWKPDADALFEAVNEACVDPGSYADVVRELTAATDQSELSVFAYCSCSSKKEVLELIDRAITRRTSPRPL